jgi:putative peptidoglycan lipid II flippase
LVAPGFNFEDRLEFIKLSRILLLSPLFLGLSGHIASIVQSFKKFFVYALSPVLYNIGIIFGTLFLYPRFGLSGLAMGVILGSILHFAIQWPTVKATGYAPQLTRKINWNKVREVLLVSVPRTLTLGSSAIAGIVLTRFASLLAVGSITVYTFSFNLQAVPLSIIGVSFSMAAFPTLSALFAGGKRDGFNRELSQAAIQIIFWSLPATALFIVLRAQIVRTILGAGQFDWTSTRLVAAALAIFSVSLVAQGLVFLFVRGYYATGRTRAPLYSNIISALFIIALAPILLYIFNNSEGFRYFIGALFRVSDVPGIEILMLPLAYTIGIFVNLILHWYYFSREFGFMSVFSEPLRHSLYCAIVIGSVSYGALAIFDGIFNLNKVWGIFLQGFCSGMLGIICGAVLLYLLKNEQFTAILKALRGRFWRTKAILPPQEELPL